MKTFKLQIIAPNKIFYDGVCTMVEYNTMEGYVGVYADHIPMTQILKLVLLNLTMSSELK